MESLNNLLANNPMWTICLIIAMAGVIVMLMVDASKKASKNNELKQDVILFAKSLSLLLRSGASGYNIHDLYLTRQGYFNGVEYKEENLINLATEALLINLKKSIDYEKTIKIGDPRLKALEQFDNNSYRTMMQQLSQKKLLDYSEEVEK
jgi:hypothetical protein